MKVIITPRLTLRPPARPDAEDIALWLSDWNVARMLGPVPHPYRLADAQEWIGQTRRRPGDLVYTIHRERLIGVVSIDGVGAQPRLGYWLGAPWHGRGYMNEAVRVLLAHAFDDRGMRSVQSSVFADNPASLNLQRKLGFDVTGTGESWCLSRQAKVRAWTTVLTAEAFATSRAQPHREALA